MCKNVKLLQMPKSVRLQFLKHEYLPISLVFFYNILISLGFEQNNKFQCIKMGFGKL